jgi:hypothetical protein
MTRYAAYTALATGAALVGLQVVAVTEFTEGASLYTRASGIAAVLCVAALPIWIETAYRTGSKFVAGVLCMSFLSLLAYSLPATIGRTGEVKEIKVADVTKSAADKARIEADHATTKRLVDEANRWQLNACRGGNGPDCKAATFVLNQRTASLEKLAGQLTSLNPAPVGDLGSETLAWASMGLVSAETVRRASALTFALGLDLGIWSLLLLASRLLVRETPATVSAGVFQASDLTIPADTTDEELEQLRKLLLEQGRPLTNDEVAALLAISKGESSKRVSKAVAAGLVQRRREGREVQIVLH